MTDFGTDSESISRALAELAGAREAPYYDEARDAQARSDYYAGLDRSAAPEDLLLALTSLVTQTHHTQPEYRPSQELYPSVDLQPNGRLLSIYTGDEFDPEAFIRDDVKVEQQRTRAVRERLQTRLAMREDERRAVVARIEAELPFNCEHVVPQSWFDHREPMRGDLHHLFACEKPCNNFRAAIPFFDFADFRDVVRERCGKASATGFEPNQGKGAAARATLYFLVRYPGAFTEPEGQLALSRVSVLLSWHEEFEVTVYERHRNALIHAKQGNRNPFVDEPALAPQVGHLLGTG